MDIHIYKSVVSKWCMTFDTYNAYKIEGCWHGWQIIINIFGKIIFISNIKEWKNK